MKRMGLKKMENNLEAKNAFEIKDMMRLMNIKSRVTFWRRCRTGEVPPPDSTRGYPRWYKSSLLKTMPYLFVAESNQTTNPSV